jgi:CBS domain-containing protein
MALTLEANPGEYLSGRGAKRLFDEVCEGIFQELRQLPTGEGRELLAQVRNTLEKEVDAEQQFQQEFRMAREEVLRARSPEELARLHEKLDGLVTAYFVRRESIPAFHAHCTTILDIMVSRALQLTEEELARDGFGVAPCYVLLVLGPAGRRETTPAIELEGLLVHESGADATEYCAELTGRAIGILERSGFRKSGRSIMPDDPAWRASLDVWQDRLEELCSRSPGPRPGSLPTLPGLRLDDLLPFRKTNISTPLFEMADLRVVSGDDDLGRKLLALVRAMAARHPACILEAAHSVAALPAPFTFLGNYRVERTGSHRGKLDLNRWACLPLVSMVRLQAVAGGFAETGTLERIQALIRAGTLDVELGKRLLQGGIEIFRLKALLEVRENAGPGNGAYLLPGTLSSSDEVAFREGLEAVTNLQKVIHSNLAEKG